MRRLHNILGLQISLTAILLLTATSSGMAQDTPATDLLRESAIRLRDTGFDAAGALRGIVEFKACFGIRQSVQVNELDEIWLINARNSHHCPSDLSLISVKKFENGNWNPSTLDNLASGHLADSSKETVFFVHGDLTDDRWSLTRGVQVYRNLFKNCRARKPVRLVIWQWKSDRESARFIKDYFIKSVRSVQLGTTLALTLGVLHDRNVTVIGYSLGAQMTLTAMQRNDPTHFTGDHGYRVALIAPALDCDFTTLAANSPTIGSLIEHCEIFYNSTDRVLRAHELICKRKFGRNYVPLQKFVEMQIMSLGQIYQCDVGQEVGKVHCIVRYSSSPTIQARINQLISWQPWTSGMEFNPPASATNANGDQPHEFLISDPLRELDPSYRSIELTCLILQARPDISFSRIDLTVIHPATASPAGWNLAKRRKMAVVRESQFQRDLVTRPAR